LSKLYQYQKDFVKNNSRLIVVNKSRQIGYSTVIAYKALKECYFGNTNQLLVSSSQRQANNLMSYVENILEKSYYPDGVKLKKDSQTQKTFDNNKSIYSLPAKPETIRGFSGSITLDEFALCKDDGKILEALMPSISSRQKYSLSICSTPLGCSNKFHSVYTDVNKYPDFHRTQINCYDAIEQGCKLNLDLIRKNFDEESFKQEFECQFLDESTSFFPYDLLKSCIDDDYTNVQGRSCMGIDIGRTTDKTGIAICTESKDKFYLSNLQTLSNKDFDTQKTIIKQLYQEYGVNQCKQDKGAIGYQLSEELEKELSGYEGVFTNQINFMADVVTFTKKLMEQGKFKFNENRDLINDFHKVQKVITQNNNTTFKIERDKTGHGDRAIAVMLALYCFKENNEPGIFFV